MPLPSFLALQRLLSFFQAFCCPSKWPDFDVNMIRHGKQHGWLNLHPNTLHSLLSLYCAKPDGVAISKSPSSPAKGLAIVAQTFISSEYRRPLLTVPSDLILSKDHVESHSRTDQHLRQVIEALGDFGKVFQGCTCIYNSRSFNKLMAFTSELAFLSWCFS